MFIKTWIVEPSNIIQELYNLAFSTVNTLETTFDPLNKVRSGLMSANFLEIKMISVTRLSAVKNCFLFCKLVCLIGTVVSLLSFWGIAQLSNFSMIFDALQSLRSYEWENILFRMNSKFLGKPCHPCCLKVIDFFSLCFYADLMFLSKVIIKWVKVFFPALQISKLVFRIDSNHTETSIELY